jgi:hypothetical protein
MFYAISLRKRRTARCPVLNRQQNDRQAAERGLRKFFGSDNIIATRKLAPPQNHGSEPMISWMER